MMTDPATGPARLSLEPSVDRLFYYWAGASGARYLHTVFAVDDGPDFADACVMAVQCTPDGGRRPLAIWDTGTHGAGSANLLDAAQALGADELHVHLLAAGATGRQRAVADLVARHLPEDHGNGSMARMAVRPAAMAFAMGPASVCVSHTPSCV